MKFCKACQRWTAKDICPICGKSTDVVKACCVDCISYNAGRCESVSDPVMQYTHPNNAACGYFKMKTNQDNVKTRGAANEPSEHDAVHAPDHYCHGGIECKDCIKAALGDNYIGFLIGNVIKYTYRYRHKNGIEDLKKAQVYLGWAIDELAGESDDM